MSVIGKVTSSTVITIEYRDEDGCLRVVEFPPERWRSANRLVRRLARRGGAA